MREGQPGYPDASESGRGWDPGEEKEHVLTERRWNEKEGKGRDSLIERERRSRQDLDLVELGEH